MQIQDLNKEQFVFYFSTILLQDIDFSEIVRHPELLFRKYNFKVNPKAIKDMTKNEIIIFLHQNYIKRYIIAYFKNYHIKVNQEYVNELITFIIKTYICDYNEMRRL